MPLRIAAIIVHFRTPHDTAQAVRSLLTSSRPPADIIIVNNDESSDGGSWLLELRDAVVWHEATRNTGFAGGVNEGVRVARSRGAEAVLLVNSDAVVSARCIEQLESSLLASPDAGIAGPTVLSSAERDRIQSLGLRYGQGSGRLRHIGFGSRLATVGTGTHAVDAVAGCLMLVRTSVFDRIGFFDEDFFFGFEEVEFCLRARRSGIVSVVNREAVTYHAGGTSIGRTSARRLYFAARNHLLLGHKLHPQASTSARAIRNAAIVSLNVAHALKAEGGSVLGRLRAVGRGTADYFAGRVGRDESPD